MTINMTPILVSAAREKINTEFHKNRNVSNAAAVEEVSAEISHLNLYWHPRVSIL